MKVGIVFPDYASQFVGMGKGLYDNSRIIQEYFEEASSCLNINFVKLCFASSEAELSKIEHAFPALFLVSSAIAAHLTHEGISADVVAGYNIGQYAALHVAGSLSLPDGLYFLSKYAHIYTDLLQELDVQIIKISGLAVSKIKHAISRLNRDDQKLYINAYLSQQDFCVVGDAYAIDLLRKELSEIDGVFITQISVEGGLRAPFMEPLVANLAAYAEKIDFNDAQIPCIMDVSGDETSVGKMIKTTIFEQVTAPIMWDKVLSKMHEWDIIIEVGPGSTLTQQLTVSLPEKKIYTINNLSDIELLKAAVKK